MTPHDWPPLIRADRAPAWMRVRDFALTLGAWAVLAWILRYAIGLGIDWVSAPVSELTRSPALDWNRMWRTLLPFLGLAALLAAWLLFWAARRRAVLTRKSDRFQPAELGMDEHAAGIGMEAAEARRLRSLTVATVHFDAAGKPVKAEGPLGPR